MILLAAVPVTAFLIWLLLDRIWQICGEIEKRRWLLFFFPALIAALFLTWYFHKAPSVWHNLQIIPAASSSNGIIELHEIKYPPGRTLKFSRTKIPNGWKLEDGILKAAGAQPAPLAYSFMAPIGQPASLLFMRSPSSRGVTIILDGKTAQVELASPSASFQSVEINTSYKAGIPAAVILFLITVTDFFTFFFCMLLIWVIQEIAQTAPAKKINGDNFLPHRTNLIILIALAFSLHTLSFFSVPLITASDSLDYLKGADHWMQHHNLDGVPAARGPGTTFLFIPAFLIFGKNPWGVKIVLHLLAIGSVPMLYALGWKLYKQRALAFFSALIAVLMPELYLFSNYVTSDASNVFFVLAYCVALLAALEEFSWKNLLTWALTGAFAVLLRPENVLLLAIGAAFLFLKILWEKVDIKKRTQIFGVAIMLAAIPLIYWSAHNYRLHGFFGLSSYADEVLYDGWVYFGEASRIQITDPNSPAVQKIQRAINAYDQPLGETFVPTGWEIFPALIHYGYTEQQAIKLLGAAARDSIRKNPELALQLYSIKIKKAFTPSHSGVAEKTFIPIEENGKIIGAMPYDKTGFFESEQTAFTAFIPWQRKIYDFFPVFDYYIYRPLVFFCLGVALLAIYQKQFLKWLPIIAIVFSRMFVPITIGIAHWHYMMAGIALLLTFIFLAIQNLRGFLSFLLNPTPE